MLAVALSAAASSLDSTRLHAYMVIAGPGQEVYSVFGHTSLRLTCEDNGMDYCFSFEVDTEKSGSIDFMLRRSKAGFVAVETPLFLKEYTDHGRSVKQYELALTHHEIQNLWRNLDKQIEKGSDWTFDYYNINCTSMVLTELENALDGRALQFNKINDAVYGTYYDCLDYMAEKSPWARLFWRAVLYEGGSKKGDIIDMISPRILDEAMMDVALADSTGRTTPLVVSGGYKLVAPQTASDEPYWITPTIALMALLVAIGDIVAVIMIRRRRKIKDQ